MSDFLGPHGLKPTRLLCPWDFPGKSTGVGCHCLLRNNALTEIKNTLEGTNSRITEAEDRISEMEDRMVEINEAERKKELKEMRTTSETSGIMLNASTFDQRSARRRRKRERA